MYLRALTESLGLAHKINYKKYIWYATFDKKLYPTRNSSETTKGLAKLTAKATFATSVICFIASLPVGSNSDSKFTQQKHTCPAFNCTSNGYMCNINPTIIRTMASSCELKKSMSEWSFSDPSLASLPLESELNNYVRRHVPKVIFSQIKPTPLQRKRKLVAVSPEALRDIVLGLF